VLISVEPITDVGTTAGETLGRLDAWLAGRGVTLALDPAHPTLDDAVAAFIRRNGERWCPVSAVPASQAWQEGR
jgi:hypothetical protein